MFGYPTTGGTFPAYLTVAFCLLSNHQYICPSTILKSKFECLRIVLNHYNDLYDCPWDITVSCSAPDLICYKNDSLCGVADRLPVNISMAVFWSSVPILWDERSVKSDCPCKEVTFTCHIAIENNTVRQDICDDAKPAPCPEEKGNLDNGLIGAVIGGAVFIVLVIVMLYLITKYRNKKQSRYVKETGETTTRKPADRPASYCTTRDKQSRSTGNSHIYNTIIDNTPKVSHVRPIVKNDIGTPSETKNSISTNYSHLNELEFQECGNGDDYAVSAPRAALSATKDYDVVNNACVNEYLDVVGEGCLNSNELISN
ncbi:uncharacterized protein LOC111110361 [Crassostrea virginica]|uniref:Uncharacterized protein LOC111110361 n=1 Tax=Crassostrea virginica TaxID=6565 RepID=A0A8B8BH03_CRAVI|nr:uncharacterized protein LOC111110361 [Crassostrea virginica]